MTTEIKDKVKDYIMKEFLPGEDPDALEDTLSLIGGGILDSIATLKLVAFLEEAFEIQVQAHEASPDYLDTLTHITSFVQSKLS